MNPARRAAPPDPRPDRDGATIWMAGLIAVVVILLLLFTLVI